MSTRTPTYRPGDVPTFGELRTGATFRHSAGTGPWRKLDDGSASLPNGRAIRFEPGTPVRQGLILVACGGVKLGHAAPAAELYFGPYFSDCLAYARSVADDADIRILSAKHGLVGLDTVLEPYNTTIGDPDAIGDEALRAQAESAGLLDRWVTVVGGSRYVELAARAWHLAACAIPRGLGIGEQRSYLRAAAVTV